MPREWSKPWLGGRTFIKPDGSVGYTLERMIGRHRYTKTLAVASETEALVELALFDRDPLAYKTKREETRDRIQAAVKAKEDAVILTEELVDGLIEYMERRKVTLRHRTNVRFYLAQWTKDLEGRDLRSVTFQDLKRIKAKYKGVAERKRISALKTLTAYLREEGLLDHREDPTLGLAVPPPRPEKAIRSKGYSLEFVEQIYAAINPWSSSRPGWGGRVPDVQAVRDVLCIQVKTGMHQTEVERLTKPEDPSAGVQASIREVEGQGAIVAVVRFIHKSGRVHIQSIDAQTLAAIRRLRVRGGAPVDSYIRKVVSRAYKSLNLKERLKFGQLRHTFVTNRPKYKRVEPVTGGMSLDEIARIIGHATVRTTSMHYDNTEIPPMALVPIRLFHPDDPQVIGESQRLPAQGS
jgi:integrase